MTSGSDVLDKVLDEGCGDGALGVGSGVGPGVVAGFDVPDTGPSRASRSMR